MKETVIVPSLIHHMRKTCRHPATASHHITDMCQCKGSWISDNTHLRVPFSPLSRLVKRLYKRVIWLWETEEKKRKKKHKLACQWFLIGTDLITLNYSIARSCVQKKDHTNQVTLQAHSNQQFRDFVSGKLHLNIQESTNKPTLQKSV